MLYCQGEKKDNYLSYLYAYYHDGVGRTVGCCGCDIKSG